MCLAVAFFILTECEQILYFLDDDDDSEILPGSSVKKSSTERREWTAGADVANQAALPRLPDRA